MRLLELEGGTGHVKNQIVAPLAQLGEASVVEAQLHARPNGFNL